MSRERANSPRKRQSQDGRRRNPSSWDIAHEANVSQSTVSRVLNNSPRISEATARRVRDAMARLGYTPNAAARALITGRSNLLGLVVSNITNPFYPEVIEAVVATAAEQDYNVVLCNTQESKELQASYLDLLIEHQVDGAILTSSLLGSGEILSRVGMDRIPLVTVNRTVQQLSVDSVRLDNVEAGRIVAAHLVKLGHRSVGFVGGLPNTSTNDARLRGFTSGLADLEVVLPAEHVVSGSFTHDSGYSLAQALLALNDRPTALFCADDQVALGVMDAAVDAGLQVPEDLAIVGVDDVRAASLRPIALTTVRQPAAEMGRRAVQLLLERLHGNRSDEPIEIVLRPRLVVRHTCGALAHEVR